jgi:hypothetical protein
MKEYARKIGTSDPLCVEMWRMYLRTQFAWRQGFHFPPTSSERWLKNYDWHGVSYTKAFKVELTYAFHHI